MIGLIIVAKINNGKINTIGIKLTQNAFDLYINGKVEYHKDIDVLGIIYDYYMFNTPWCAISSITTGNDKTIIIETTRKEESAMETKHFVTKANLVKIIKKLDERYESQFSGNIEELTEEEINEVFNELNDTVSGGAGNDTLSGGE